MKVDIPIGQRIFSIECDENSSHAIKKYGLELNKRVNSLTRSIDGIDNQTAIVLTSILMIGEIEDLSKKSDNEALKPIIGNEIPAQVAADEEVEFSAATNETITIKERTTEIKNDLFEDDRILISRYVIESMLSKICEIEENVRKVK